ncbi:MAG: hypothetical protein JG764_1712, partial [Clostridiales bacterium]|nr:hypothetical protein [Clostridiales bacterium]
LNSALHEHFKFYLPSATFYFHFLGNLHVLSDTTIGYVVSLTLETLLNKTFIDGVYQSKV